MSAAKPRVVEKRAVPIQDHGRIWDRVADGESVVTIAAEYGVTRNRIYQIARGAVAHRQGTASATR